MLKLLKWVNSKSNAFASLSLSPLLADVNYRVFWAGSSYEVGLRMAHGDHFNAISDPTRRFLLEEIRRSPKTVNELASGLTISRPAVSQHLKVLRDSGLVHVDKHGTKRLYAVNSSGFDKLNAWMDQFWSRCGQQ